MSNTNKIEVIFDVETKKFFDEIEGNNPQKLGVSIVSLYVRSIDENLEETKGEMKSFWEKDFSKMWKIFQSADRIIGFNSIKFDVPALEVYANFPFSKLPHFDILEHIKKQFGKRISLNSIAKDTLKIQKLAQGSQAVYWWEKGDEESLNNLKKYCEQDVKITKEIYDFGLKNKYLKFTDKWNTERTINVNFEYLQQNPQASLF